MEELFERIDAIRGYLLVVNFRENHYSCEIYTEDNMKCIPCTFDEDTEDVVATAIRHLVYAIGIAAYQPQNSEILEFHIKELFILEMDDSPSQAELEKALNEYRSQNDTAAKFKQSWREVKQGKTYPISQLWDELDAE
jgi:hypothetical protein